MNAEVHERLYDVARQARQLQDHLRRSLRARAGREEHEIVLKLGLYSLTVLGSLARQSEALADLILAVQGIVGKEDT